MIPTVRALSPLRLIWIRAFGACGWGCVVFALIDLYLKSERTPTFFLLFSIWFFLVAFRLEYRGRA